MHQTNHRYEDYLVNNRKFKEFKVKDIDFVFVTHNHIDHVGLIPKLYRDGFRGATIVSENSKQILKDKYMQELDAKTYRNYFKKLTFLEQEIRQKIVIQNEIRSQIYEETKGRGR